MSLHLYPQFKFQIFHTFTCFHHLRVPDELTTWPAPSWLDSSVGIALHSYRRGHEFESRSNLNFLRWSFMSWHLSPQFKLKVFHIFTCILSIVYNSTTLIYTFFQIPLYSLCQTKNKTKRWRAKAFEAPTSINLWQCYKSTAYRRACCCT